MPQKGALTTGASSRIGETTAHRLQQAGFDACDEAVTVDADHAFAGARITPFPATASE